MQPVWVFRVLMKKETLNILAFLQHSLQLKGDKQYSYKHISYVNILMLSILYDFIILSQTAQARKQRQTEH